MALGLLSASIGAIGSVGGALLSRGNDSSANQLSMQDMYNLEMYNTIKDLYFMNKQHDYNSMSLADQFNYNKEAMRYQTDLQRELNEQAFNYNNYFLDNAYQKSVNSMRAAGLNPLLLAGNSPSVGSASAGGAGLAGSSSLGIQQGSHGIDPASMLSASANSAQAKIAKSQLAINFMNAVTDLGIKITGSAKQAEEAKTQKTIQDLNKYETLNKAIDTQLKNVELHYKSDKEKSEIYKNLYTTKAQLLQAEVADFLKESQRYSNYTSANANYINATTGNPTKVIVDLIKSIAGDDPQKGSKDVYDYVKGKVTDSYGSITDKPTKDNNYHFNDYDMKILRSLYFGLGLDKKGVKF